MDEINPYRPPEAALGTTRDAGRYRPLATVVRVLIGLWGLFILAGPSRNGGSVAFPPGEIASKALGAILFMIAVFPLRRPKAKSRESRENLVEDL
jgi:hypothetical protein